MKHKRQISEYPLHAGFDPDLEKYIVYHAGFDETAEGDTITEAVEELKTSVLDKFDVLKEVVLSAKKGSK